MQPSAVIGQAVLGLRRHDCVHGPFDQTVILQRTKNLNQHLLRDIGNLSLQLVETAYTPRETIEHDRRPLIANHVKQPARREASVKYFGCVKGSHSEFYNSTGLTPTRAVSAKPPSL